MTTLGVWSKNRFSPFYKNELMHLWLSGDDMLPCKFGHSRWKPYECNYEYQKNLTSRIPPFKVTGTNTDRLATYDFLLVIHSDLGPISYRFQE